MPHAPYEPWLSVSRILSRISRDDRWARYDTTVQRYLSVSDAAYLEVVNPNNQNSLRLKILRELMVEGAHNGHRALEHQYPLDGRTRIESSRLVVASTVAKSRILACQQSNVGGHGLLRSRKSRSLTVPTLYYVDNLVESTQLRRYSVKLSRHATQWALFMGQVDAMAAQQEYEAVLLALIQSKSMRFYEVIENRCRRIVYAVTVGDKRCVCPFL